MKLQIWGEHIETIAIKFCKLMMNILFNYIFQNICLFSTSFSKNKRDVSQCLIQISNCQD